MTLEEQVCSLELAQRLKELGVKQESLCYWRLAYFVSERFDNGISLGKKGKFGDYHVAYHPRPRFSTADLKWNENDLTRLNETELSAFSVAELGELLPPFTKSFRDKSLENPEYWIRLEGEEEDLVHAAKTEANARAKMLVHLIENNLIKL